MVILADLETHAVQEKRMNDAWRKVVDEAGGLASAVEYYGKGSRAERLWINRVVKAYAEVEAIRKENVIR
jgi:hypothetical protein